MRVTVTTEIEGLKIKVTGRYRKSDNCVIDRKGMVLKIQNGDNVVFHETKKRTKQTPCPFEMHQWFNKTKQI